MKGENRQDLLYHVTIHPVYRLKTFPVVVVEWRELGDFAAPFCGGAPQSFTAISRLTRSPPVFTSRPDQYVYLYALQK